MPETDNSQHGHEVVATRISKFIEGDKEFILLKILTYEKAAEVVAYRRGLGYVSQPGFIWTGAERRIIKPRR